MAYHTGLHANWATSGRPLPFTLVTPLSYSSYSTPGLRASSSNGQSSQIVDSGYQSDREGRADGVPLKARRKKAGWKSMLARATTLQPVDPSSMERVESNSNAEQPATGTTQSREIETRAQASHGENQGWFAGLDARDDLQELPVAGNAGSPSENRASGSSHPELQQQAIVNAAMPNAGGQGSSRLPSDGVDLSGMRDALNESSSDEESQSSSSSRSRADSIIYGNSRAKKHRASKNVAELKEKVDYLNGKVSAYEAASVKPRKGGRRHSPYMGPRRRSPLSNRQAEEVRKHLDLLLDQSKDPFPTQRTIEDFVEKGSHGGRPCCTVDEFQIDLHGGPRSLWNRSSAEVFADDYIEVHGLDVEAKDAILERFFTRIKTIKFMKDGKRDKRRLNQKGRKKTLFNMRLEIVCGMPKLRPYEKLLRDLGPDNMSSDESEGEVEASHTRIGKVRPRYRVLTPRWRSSVLTKFLHDLDVVYWLERKMDPERQRGNWPRIRLYDPRRVIISPSRALPRAGLPRNIYDDGFLQEVGEGRVAPVSNYEHPFQVPTSLLNRLSRGGGHLQE